MNEPENKSPAILASAQPAVKFRPVKFVHEKSSQFRTYHANGVWGVVNAENEIHLSFFTEYPRLATEVINEVDPANGAYTGKFEMRGDADPNYYVVTREFQCSVALSLQSAIRVQTVLASFIKIAQDALPDQKALAEQKK